MTITLNSTTSGTVSGQFMNFTKPSVSNGDVLVAVIGSNSRSSITPPSGWTVRSYVFTTGASSEVQISTRVIDGTEGSTLAFNYGTSNFIFLGKLFAFSGCDPNFPVDVANNNFTWNSGPTDVLPALTTRIDNDYIVATCLHDVGPGVTPTLIDFPGTSLFYGTTTNHGWAIDGFFQTPAGSTGTMLWTFSNNAPSSVAMAAIALRPSGFNLPPSVDIGPDVAIIYGDTYTGNAVGSDVESPVSYAWTIASKPSGSTRTITGATTATPTFKPDKVGTYDLSCTVTDNGGLTATDDVILTVRAEMWTKAHGGIISPAQRRIRKNGAVY